MISICIVCLYFSHAGSGDGIVICFKLRYLNNCLIINFMADIHGAQRVNPTDFIDALFFPLMPSSAQNVSKTMGDDQIPSKLVTFQWPI